MSQNFFADLFDPGNFFHDTDSSRLAKKQYQTEKDIAYLNYEEQKRVNDANIRAQQEAFNYQKELNAMQMEREDTAVARRVADLKAAGISPTLAAGSSASATPVHAGTAPQGVAPQLATPSDIRVQQAMFREQMLKDRMALAMSVMGNLADVSRTKAETELIKAQKDRYVAETPIELRLKTLLQEHNEVINPLIENQMKLNLSIDELKKDNQILTNAIASNTVAAQALELIIKQAEANNADRKYKAQADKLQEEVKEKSLAVQMAEHIVNYENQHGVPISAMSPVAKTFWPLSDAGASNIKKHGIDSFKKSLDMSPFGQAWNKALEVSDKVRSKIRSFFTPKVLLVPKRKR